MNSEINELYRLLTSSKHCVAFTGAGISTLSGIQDFRGKNGLYKKPNTELMFDINAFMTDPSIYYSMARDYIYDIDSKEPSVVHRVLAQLERLNILHAIITQNIDLLHQKAGSEKVIEIHGSPAIHSCPSCKWQTGFYDILDTVKSGGMPHCPNCGAVLKPNIVFFGESLPEFAIDSAISESSKSDLMLVLGSSLVVYPAASLPEYTLNSGGQIVIVNDMPTHLDKQAALHFDDLELTFSGLEEIIAS